MFGKTGELHKCKAHSNDNKMFWKTVNYTKILLPYIIN